MKKEIAEGADRAARVVTRIVRKTTKEGDAFLPGGIGNSLGVGQGKGVD
jgi:hypothetical protein